MQSPNWESIAAEYIETEISMSALAKKHALPRTTLRDHAARGAWRARREQWRARRADREADCRDEGGERLLRVTDKLVRRAEEIADSADELAARELGELMRALKSASAIRQQHTAAESGEKAAEGALTIAFSPEAEEAAQ